MAARHLVVLGCLSLALVLPLPTTSAEFQNEDLVFEEPVSLPRWRPVRHKRTVHLPQVQTIDSPITQHTRDSDSDPGLWTSAMHSLSRIKRSFWNPWSDSSEEKTTEASTTISEDASSTDTKFTSDPLPTLPRDTRSTDNVEEFNATNPEDTYPANFSDDEDIAGTSGDSSGELELLPSEPTENRPSSPDYRNTLPDVNCQRVFHRLTLTVHEPYREDFADRNSDLFKEFSEGFAQELDTLFTDIPGKQQSGVINIERGDESFTILVTLDISSDCFDNPDEVRSLVHDRINDYRAIGRYTVSNDNFDFRNIRDPGETFYPTRREPCAPGEIECTTIINTGTRCLTNDARCNGTIECDNGDDEKGCPSRGLAEETTMTTTTTTTTTTTEAASPEPSTERTISRTDSFSSNDRCRADDKVRCADGSTFICDDQQCDGKSDCPGGDDEQNCPSDNDECSDNEFSCDLTRCIPKSEVCDGEAQCHDKTDEQNCPPQGKETSSRSQSFIAISIRFRYRLMH